MTYGASCTGRMEKQETETDAESGNGHGKRKRPLPDQYFVHSWFILGYIHKRPLPNQLFCVYLSLYTCADCCVGQERL